MIRMIKQEITKLKEENISLKQKLSQYINLFINLIKYLKSKIFHKDRDKYYEISKDLYSHGALDLNSIKDINNIYNSNIKNNKSKNNDNLEL